VDQHHRPQLTITYPKPSDMIDMAPQESSGQTVAPGQAGSNGTSSKVGVDKPKQTFKGADAKKIARAGDDKNKSVKEEFKVKPTGDKSKNPYKIQHHLNPEDHRRPKKRQTSLYSYVEESC
jgi:hypothetical protein